MSPQLHARALPAGEAELPNATAEGRWAETLITGLGTAFAVVLISLVGVLLVIF